MYYEIMLMFESPQFNVLKYFSLEVTSTEESFLKIAL